jgi:hypothetical protein
MAQARQQQSELGEEPPVAQQWEQEQEQPLVAQQLEQEQGGQQELVWYHWLRQ